MYLNTYQFDHVFFSETRAYMALVMGRQWLSSCWVHAEDVHEPAS